MDTKLATNGGQWKPGKSGNPKGRPARGRAFQDALQQCGDKPLIIGGEAISRWQVVAEAVWQLVATGEVWLSGRRLTVENGTEWLNVIKWFSSQVTTGQATVDEPEMVVRVVRENFYHREHGEHRELE